MAELNSQDLAPHSVEAEEAVLGAVLINPDCFSEIKECLTADSFYIVRHGWLWEAFLSLDHQMRAIDYLTVVTELESMGRLPEMGGAAFVLSLINKTPSSLNVGTWADIVLDRQTRRLLIDAAGLVARYAHSEDMPIVDVMARAEGAVFEVTDQHQTDLTTIGTALSDEFDRMAYHADNPDALLGCRTYINALDDLVYSLLPGQMITVAGRTGQGKTSFIIGVLTENLLRGVPVGLITLEMSAAEISRRVMSYNSGLEVKRLERARLSDQELGTFTAKIGEMGNWPFPIADKPRMFLHDARAQLRRMKHRYNIQLAAIDYLQLLQADPDVEGKRFQNREREVSYISAEIKKMARELQIPIIAVAQLSRATEYRADKRPILSDLRESGAIEQDSDVVIFLYREWYYNRDANIHEAEISVAKQRNGPLGTIKAWWEPAQAKFTNATIRSVNLDDVLNGRDVYRGGE